MKKLRDDILFSDSTIRSLNSDTIKHSSTPNDPQMHQHHHEQVCLGYIYHVKIICRSKKHAR